MSDRTLSRIRAWLGSSQLREGARLPPERTLASSLGLSRAELRKALLVLEAEGRLERKVGRGTFLANQRVPRSGKGSGGDIAALAERTGPHEAMIARLAFEPNLPVWLRCMRRHASWPSCGVWLMPCAWLPVGRPMKSSMQRFMI